MEVNSRALAAQQKKEFLELRDSLKQFSGNDQEWYILVKWSEPDSEMNWTNFDGYGPLNDRFFSWLNYHWNYWQDRGAVPIQVVEIHRLPHEENGNDSTW